MLEVKLLNCDIKNIPITCAIHISEEQFEQIVNGIKEKNLKKTEVIDKIDKLLLSDKFEREEVKVEEAADRLEEVSKGLLRDKIGECQLL